MPICLSSLYGDHKKLYFWGAVASSQKKLVTPNHVLMKFGRKSKKSYVDIF